MSNYYKPTTKFDDLKLPPRASSAYDVVKSLDDEQVRWALWMALVICFGSAESNSTDLLSRKKPDDEFPFACEAQLLLMQIGMGRTRASDVSRFESTIRQLLVTAAATNPA